jgi:hypothetical protein
VKRRLPEPFIAQGLIFTLRPGARHVVPWWLCCCEPGPSRGVILSGHITLYTCPGVVSWTNAALWGHIIAPCMFACALVTHERALETHVSNYVHRATKSLFIPMVHSPSGVVRNVAAPELPSQEGRARSRETRGSTEAPLSKRRSPELWDT